jgi:hypothetical protein
MSKLFGMQRANGDWFALSNNGSLRMTVFLSVAEAMSARSRNSEMECFRPVALDKGALDALTAADGDTVCFCLVSDPSRKLKRARPIELAELRSIGALRKQSKQSSE